MISLADAHPYLFVPVLALGLLHEATEYCTSHTSIYSRLFIRRLAHNSTITKIILITHKNIKNIRI